MAQGSNPTDMQEDLRDVREDMAQDMAHEGDTASEPGNAERILDNAERHERRHSNMGTETENTKQCGAEQRSTGKHSAEMDGADPAQAPDNTDATPASAYAVPGAEQYGNEDNAALPEARTHGTKGVQSAEGEKGVQYPADSMENSTAESIAQAPFHAPAHAPAHTPAVSVLVPVYNVEKYIRECLDSIIAQTLKDIEIICVEDGSTDSSLRILQEYAAKDARVVVISKPNGGLPSARNAGLDAARGKYIGFIDGDDYISPDMYRRMYDTAFKHKADIVVCGAQPFPAEAASSWLKDTLSPESTVCRGGGTDALFEVRGARPFLWRDLICREIIEKHHFRLDENIVVGEDQAFQFKVFPAARVVAFIPDKLYHYRISRPESIMNAPQYTDYSSRVAKHVRMVESICRSWKDMGTTQGTIQGMQDAQRKENAQSTPGTHGVEIAHKDWTRLFQWAVDFIYWDIIRVSPADKKKISRDFCRMLADAGYHDYTRDYTCRIRGHFRYMEDLAYMQDAYMQGADIYSTGYGAGTAEAGLAEPVVSIVAVFGKDADYISSFLESVLSQTERRIEVLLYVNGSNEATAKVVHEWLYKDPRICVRTGDWAPVSEKYNDAIRTAKGKYICFLSPLDYIRDSHWLESAVRIFSGEDIYGSTGAAGNAHLVGTGRACGAGNACSADSTGNACGADNACSACNTDYACGTDSTAHPDTTSRAGAGAASVGGCAGDGTQAAGISPENMPEGPAYTDADNTADNICAKSTDTEAGDIYSGGMDIDLVGYTQHVSDGEYGRGSVMKCQNAYYRNFLYRTDKIRAEGILFEDYSLLIGSVFYTRYCLASSTCYFIPEYMHHSETLRRTCIYADEAKRVLRALVWLLQIAKDHGLTKLTRHITELLNSENYIRLITDATYGFYVNPSSVDNPKEDFHTEVLSLLMKANELACLDGQDRALLRTLAVFISRRHLFLEKM